MKKFFGFLLTIPFLVWVYSWFFDFNGISAMFSISKVIASIVLVSMGIAFINSEEFKYVIKPIEVNNLKNT